MVPILPCQNWPWIIGSKIYGEGRAKVPLSSPNMIDVLTQDPGQTGSILNRKIASNTKINHLMVYFTDHYNDIDLDRLPSKSKIGNDQWYFNNSLLCKPEFSSTTKNFLLLLQSQKTSHPSAIDRRQYIHSCFKENARSFSKNSTTQEYIIIPKLKKDYKTFTKK